jgi:hypothetical protein
MGFAMEQTSNPLGGGAGETGTATAGSSKKQIPLYAKTTELETTCRGFVGQRIALVAEFMGRKIPVTNTNLVGDMLEDIFFHGGLKDLGDFEEGPKQASPDFYAEDKRFHFEQKVFANSPGFDIGNFESLVAQMTEDGGLFKKLFLTRYLVFQYKIVDDQVEIKSFDLLNIWELVGYDGKNPISMQDKRGTWYNIRPQARSTWSDATKTPQRFVDALKECIRVCPQVQDKETKIARIDEQWAAICSEYTLE